MKISSCAKKDMDAYKIEVMENTLVLSLHYLREEIDVGKQLTVLDI